MSPQSLALPALNKIIQQGIDFDVVFCLNDPTALGALASIEENDLGQVKQVPFVQNNLHFLQFDNSHLKQLYL